MRKRISAGALILVLATGLVGAESPRPRQGNLQPGDLAPDFTARDVNGENPVTLSDLQGKPVVLIFGSCT